MRKIYFPMTCSIITRGHIECLEYLLERGNVVIGLLNSKALKGYKKEVVPFKDRKFVLMVICDAICPHIDFMEQDSLDPTLNIHISGCDSIATGDGFEESERNAIRKLGLKTIIIKLKGEREKKYSSSKILNEYSNDKARHRLPLRVNVSKLPRRSKNKKR